MLGSPRTLYALAHDGQLPRALARVHPRYQTPANAVITYGVISLALALSGSFRQLAIVSSAGTLLLYLICCLGVLRLRGRHGRSPDAFRAPAGPLVPILASLVVIWLLSGLRGPELDRHCIARPHCRFDVFPASSIRWPPMNPLPA